MRRLRLTGSRTDSPEMVVVTFRDANPFYDTSYSVNSANLGPYGNAIVTELIPVLEEQFGLLAEPWAEDAGRRLDRRLGGTGHASVLSRLLRCRLGARARSG